MTETPDTPTQLFLGGAWADAADGAVMPVDDPATGEILAHVADAGPKDARLAEEAAVQAQQEWARTAPRARSEILRRAHEIVLERTDELARLMTSEMGKPLAEARGEVAYAAEFLRWFSEEAVRIDGGHGILPDGRHRMILSRRPVGPCLLITPWNFPLAMGARKIGPAIAAGCTMVLKPAPQTPLSSLALAAILKEAGLPDGVLNVVTTSRAGEVCEPLLRGGRIRKLSFTGSTAVGRLLLAQCADTVVRTSMELGGNAPFVVFDDADLDAAVDGAMVAKMRNMGEAPAPPPTASSCTARWLRTSPTGWPGGWRRSSWAPEPTTAWTSARSSTLPGGPRSRTWSPTRWSAAPGCWSAAPHPRAPAASTRPRCSPTSHRTAV
ncbi:acyl-CoA reductase-like NAD-dependent aldehyde dehydrogenase [Streptomyces ambofaciens]